MRGKARSAIAHPRNTSCAGSLSSAPRLRTGRGGRHGAKKITCSPNTEKREGSMKSWPMNRGSKGAYGEAVGHYRSVRRRLPWYSIFQKVGKVSSVPSRRTATDCCDVTVQFPRKGEIPDVVYDKTQISVWLGRSGLWPRRIKNADIARYLHLDPFIHVGGGGAPVSQFMCAQDSSGAES